MNIGEGDKAAQLPAADVYISSPPSPTFREPTFEDKARLYLAYLFVAIFALTILFACIAVLLNHNTWPNMKELLSVIMPAETALLGAATGFYFGAKK